MKWIRSHFWLCFIFLLAMFMQSRQVAAQLAPTGGHYAARASDTGFAGAVNSSGGYSASVPLNLPAARGGLPLMLDIVYGGHRVGAAGLGWDIPISYILRDATIAHRRPINNPDATPQPRERLYLMIEGKGIDLIRNQAGTAWEARVNDPQLEVRDVGGGAMVMYDGDGRTYKFNARDSLGHQIADGNLYLLTDVTGPDGNDLHLQYDITTPVVTAFFFDELPSTGLAINLTNIWYNLHPTTAGCYKNKITLDYDAPSPLDPDNFPNDPALMPLAMWVLSNNVLVRVQKLSHVLVYSTPNCTSAPVRLRTYFLKYESDPDTDQPQLKSVTMSGQQGTAEQNVEIPVATYTYGSATVGGKLSYQKTQSLALPVGADSHGIASTFSDSRGIPPTDPNYSQSQGSITLQNLIDVNGDGRPDFTFEKGGQLFATRNTSGFNTNGGPVAFPSLFSQVIEGQGSSITEGLEMNSAQVPRAPFFLLDIANNTDMVWRQSIDVNGDGRLDIIDAKEQAGFWVVYLNTPDPIDPRLVDWVRRRISIAPIVNVLRDAGYKVSADYLPLSERITSSALSYPTCWEYTDHHEWVNQHCRPNPSAILAGTEQSFVVWQLLDINGDGYPDFVYDSYPLQTKYVDNPAPFPIPPKPHVGDHASGKGVETLGDSINTNIKAMFNVVGMQLGDNTHAFSSPFVIADSNTHCSVQRWAQGDVEDGPLGYDLQLCGFIDVNGDGLPDRVVSVDSSQQRSSTRVYFNTSSLGGHYFTAQPMLWPDIQLASHNVPQYDLCPGKTPDFTYPSMQLSGLRDLNGDGIPDFIVSGGSVQFGTGAGFSSPKPIVVADGQFALSDETENCGGTRSDTTSGLYDIEGDGQPDVVALNPNHQQLDIYQLTPSYEPDSGNLRRAAGRLVKIANGYGAVTAIGYRSAKEDDKTLHQVPFPEIVVSGVEASDESGLALEAPILYAYGDATLVYDPKYDSFIFPGYQRSITLRTTNNQPPQGGVATITDSYPLAPVKTTMDAKALFARYLTAGRVSDVTTISGNVGLNPWALLNINVSTDPRRIGETHYDYDARMLPENSSDNEDCIDMVYPYDFLSSDFFDLTHGVDGDQCAVPSFVFQTAVDSWRGNPGDAPPTSTGNVHTRIESTQVDDFGRTTSVKDYNDLNRTDDDLLVTTTYAAPTGTNERVLNAVSHRSITDFSGVRTYAADSWEYDTSPSGVKLPAGSVSAGFPTAHVVSRFDMSSGNSLGDIRIFDATYDSAGNPANVITKRSDGATRRVTTTYDPFGLVALGAKTEATNADGTPLPPLDTTFTVDPITLNVLTVTDPNGTVRGNTFDGFGRVLLSTVTPSGGGASGALSSTSYLGFGTGETGGRRVVQKVFTDPVPPANVASAPGRTSTVFLDSLGRELRTEVQLGADYANQLLIIGQRIYDFLGRVLFEADPFPSSQSFTTAYGTTNYFNVDGSPSCSIRGNGQQAFTQVTNEANEVYPACVRHYFVNGNELVDARDAASLLGGSPQESVIKTDVFTATGRRVQTTTHNRNGELDRADFAYDVLGNLTTMDRFQSSVPPKAVRTGWHYDSLGQMLEFDEPAAAPQFSTYDDWGELNQVQWTDTSVSPAIDHDIITRYDALGRVTHSEERNNNIVDADTVNDFLYDHAVNVTTPPVTPTNVLGRLAKASFPTGTVSFSYDGLGDVNAKVFRDTENGVYAEKHTYHGDGSPLALDFLLPDTDFNDEHVDYSYDSAARVRSVRYSNGNSGQPLTLFNASIIDAFGRIRQATYGTSTNSQSSFTATDSDTGRRLLQDVKVTSANTASSREISFPAPTGFATAFDPLGRERARTETKNGDSSLLTFSYDPLGRLLSETRAPASQSLPNMQFTYDALGNMVTQSATDVTQNVTLTYQPPDLDRVCSIGFGSSVPNTTCNVKYDVVGNIIEQPRHANDKRLLTYFNNGQVKDILDENGNHATFRYDAFGNVQQLDLSSKSSSDTRHDRHFGALIARRDELSNGKTMSVITRTIAVPGLVATRHGPTGPWVFAFGDQQGNRFFMEAGDFVQDIDYQPFGDATSTGSAPGNATYSSAQWNEGDALAALGLSQLGARIYDPTMGRFLSRDPLLVPRTGATTNPYAFAMNDPVNNSDPSGLDEDSDDSDGPVEACQGAECNYFSPIGLPGLPGGAPYFNYDPVPAVHDSELEHITYDFAHDNAGFVQASNYEFSWWERAGNWVQAHDPTQKLEVYDKIYDEKWDDPEVREYTKDWTKEDFELQHTLHKWNGRLEAVQGVAQLADGVGEVAIARELGGAAEAGEAGSLAAGTGSARNVNFLRGNTNCVNCAIAGDMALAGYPFQALPGPSTDLSYVETIYGAKFQPVSGRTDIANMLIASGDRARGIVYGENTFWTRFFGRPGHVWNVINQGGNIRFIDFQVGGNGDFNFGRWTSFRFLLTNPGQP